MQQLKEIIADNISELRKASKMTQSDLAEKLNYSDKAVSKWERGESVPDVSVLKQIADTFGVTVDFLLTSEHKEYLEEKKEEKKRKGLNRILISIISVLGVWILAILLYMNFNLFLRVEEYLWIIYVCAVPVSAIVALIFNSIWGKRIYGYIFSSIILWSVIAVVYLSLYLFLQKNLWLLFILGVPGQLVIYLASRFKFK